MNMPTKETILKECADVVALIEAFIPEGLQEGTLNCMATAYNIGLSRGWKEGSKEVIEALDEEISK